MTISNRQVALNNFMYHTGLKARIKTMTCPSDVFIEICQQQLNIFEMRSVTALVNDVYKGNKNIKLQPWGGSIGLYLNDKIIDEVFGKDRN